MYCTLFFDRSSGQSTPHFSPVMSLSNSPDLSALKVTEEWKLQLEYDIKKWMAQLVLALEHLHINGIICKYDLVR